MTPGQKTVFAALITFVTCALFAVLLARLASRAGSNMSSAAARRILCYGDSLTVGYHSSGRAFEPYGRQLQDLLGSTYQVEKRGTVITVGNGLTWRSCRTKNGLM